MKMSLHDDIMNLPCDGATLDWANTREAYMYGHRNARHAAAELALKVEAELKKTADFWCERAETVRDERDRLRVQVEAMREDAARYRWLRDKANGEIVFDHTKDQSDGGNHFALFVPFDGREIPNDETSGQTLDEAIDAARKES
jgi:hypothetical protein